SVAGTSSASTIGELGEFPLIELLTARTGASRGDTVVGAGLDDTAVTRLSDGRLQLATIDTLVAGTHFLLDRFTPEQVGRKAAAINLSDIAAMGGSATHALAAMAAPPDLQTGVALGIVEGLVAELAAWGAELVGGNLARHDGLVVDVALLGETDDRRLLLRSGARPGDALAVTGDLGAAAAGLVLLLAERGPRDRAAEIADDDRAAVVSRQRTPRPRLDVAPLLGPAGASAAIDVSDGLAADAGHICDRSGVGVAIDVGRLPVAESTRAVAAALGLDATELALGGGEDYELLFAAAPERLAELIARVEGATGVPVTVIGRVTAEPERVAVLPDGSEHELAGGWRHFGD
ncbi:MAG: thiamine-phosphate kinase, partial [Anaerolineae bacterium]